MSFIKELEEQIEKIKIKNGTLLFDDLTFKDSDSSINISRAIIPPNAPLILTMVTGEKDEDCEPEFTIHAHVGHAIMIMIDMDYGIFSRLSDYDKNECKEIVNRLIEKIMDERFRALTNRV